MYSRHNVINALTEKTKLIDGVLPFSTYTQSCGSGSGLDPDPDMQSGSGSRGKKMDILTFLYTAILFLSVSLEES